MEQILWLYARDYDPDYPVLCFDERPCFLIGDRLEPIPMSEAKVRKEHYAYEKNGSCSLFAAIEPLMANRLAKAYRYRSRKEFTLFCQDLASLYPNAKKIRLVLDNLNTHSKGAFYAHLPADQAFALAQRFEFYFTPKSASWLNMIEIEFSALAPLCLNRRIPSMEQLESEVLAFVAIRKQKQIKINWQFSIESSRKKLARHYSKVFDSAARV